MRCIAILRGLPPDRAVPVVDQLTQAGFTEIEVPLNRTDARQTLERLAAVPRRAYRLGAGTVRTSSDLQFCQALGLDFCLSPHWDPALNGHNQFWIPGVLTPSELFSAERAGYEWVKLFPAEIERYRALKAVCHSHTRFIAVGGVSLANLDNWIAAGIDGVGIGSALFNPDDNEATWRGKTQSWSSALGLI